MGLGHQLAESSKACVPGSLESSGLAESLGKGTEQYPVQKAHKKRRGSSDGIRGCKREAAAANTKTKRWEIGQDKTIQGQVAGMARRVWNKYNYLRASIKIGHLAEKAKKRGNPRDDEREGLIDGLDPGQRLGRSLQYALREDGPANGTGASTSKVQAQAPT
ncbi:hypothetical protein BBK36DRAFT_1184050 [Trichoderma citrinoviride]|uniref:Uncharacterized protein n=1 Tax=Trichoderma citrinoviride TaxID=58853 RepID=A0A2T4B0U4_9HYPO|nr:hypothetical protein BBK36DRAFT_1184050 [Trichoderma citrinoviride]PTB62947.1 hypothetical protein BBK36DRAFT_1184050 [Trichoderma citrinoviride]